MYKLLVSAILLIGSLFVGGCTLTEQIDQSQKTDNSLESVSKLVSTKKRPMLGQESFGLAVC